MSEASLRLYLALGSNVGRPLVHLLEAFERIAAWPGCDNARLSPVYQTKPWQLDDDPEQDFLNAMMVCDLSAPDSPQWLMMALHELELTLGRVRRPGRTLSRVIDLDVILWGEQPIQHPECQVPHPRAYQRDFVLQPLLDLNPEAVLPGYGDAHTLLATIAPANRTLRGCVYMPC